MASTSTDRRFGVNSGRAIKVPCRAATTANITLSGEQTVDGVVLVTGDRVLVKNQTTGANNGIYIVDTGIWSRSPDWDGTYDIGQGTLVYVTNGTVAAGLFYVVTTSNPITIGTTSVALSVVSPSSPITLPLVIAQGGTGQATKAAGLSALGVVSLTGAGGTANAQTAAAPSSYAAFTANDLFEYTPPITNTGATTLTITPSGGGALAARNVFYDGAACAGGELVLGLPTLLLDDGTRLHIVGYSRKIRGSQLSAGSQFINGTIVPSNNATQLTLAIKTLAGADPSAADPVGVVFRNVTAGTGDYTVLWLTAATSIQTTVGGTFGVANSVAFRLWITMFNDGGTPRLGVVNCLTTAAGAGAGRDVTALNSVGLGAWGIASSTQIGAGATSAQTHYTSGAAVAAKAYATIGYLTYEAGLAAAGTFTANPSRLQLFGPGVPLPGQPVGNIQRLDTGAVAAGATTIPSDDTIPQITEGDQYMAAPAITPTSAANVLAFEAQAVLSNDFASNNKLIAAMFIDATANAILTVAINPQAAAQDIYTIKARRLANGVAATTAKLRAGGNVAGVTTFNGAGSARLFGGTSNSFIEAQEIMA